MMAAEDPWAGHSGHPRQFRTLALAAIPEFPRPRSDSHGVSMSGISARLAGSLAVTLIVAAGCGAKAPRPEPAETFTWVRQPITFSPPSGRWERQGENGNGTLGVYFVLRGGGGQCISVGAYRQLAERDRREALAKLISRRDSLSRREFLDELSLARARTEDPISDREAETARTINDDLSRAMTAYLEGSPGFVAASLDGALAAAAAYEPTLEELLPTIRLVPARMQEPDRWRIAYERDTTLAGLPAFASDDTLITPERPLLYRQVFWVVNGCAFHTTYQGAPENLKAWYRVIDTIRFPEDGHVAVR